MDFLNEGLLGSRTQFLQTLEHPIVKQRRQSSMSALARLVRPFVLRRLKTDSEIVADLPEKTEQIVAAITRGFLTEQVTAEQIVVGVRGCCRFGAEQVSVQKQIIRAGLFGMRSEDERKPGDQVESSSTHRISYLYVSLSSPEPRDSPPVDP